MHVVANSVLLGLALKPSCTACFIAPAKIDEKAEKQNNREAWKQKSRKAEAKRQQSRGEERGIPPQKMALEKKGFNMFQQRMTNNENMYWGNKRRGHAYIIKLGYTRMQTFICKKRSEKTHKERTTETEGEKHKQKGRKQKKQKRTHKKKQ